MGIVGTEKMGIIFAHEVPCDHKVTYTRLCCNYRKKTPMPHHSWRKQNKLPWTRLHKKSRHTTITMRFNRVIYRATSKFYVVTTMQIQVPEIFCFDKNIQLAAKGIIPLHILLSTMSLKHISTESEFTSLW